MLTKLLIRDETTASLGKTEYTFTVHISGETIDHCVTHNTEKNSKSMILSTDGKQRA
jgi:hypothetical protein